MEIKHLQIYSTRRLVDFLVKVTSFPRFRWLDMATCNAFCGMLKYRYSLCTYICSIFDL